MVTRPNNWVHNYVCWSEHPGRPCPRQAQVHDKDGKSISLIGLNWDWLSMIYSNKSQTRKASSSKLSSTISRITSRKSDVSLWHSLTYICQFSAAKDVNFVERITRNTDRYIKIFSNVIDEKMPQPTVNFKEEDLSTFDLLMDQRKFNMQQQLNVAMQNG